MALTSVALADGLPTVPYLYVEGRAEVEKNADLVSLAFKLSARDEDVTKAHNAVQAQALKVFALLSAVGIPDGDIAASDILSDEDYEQGAVYGPRGKFLGYRVVRHFTVKIRDLAKFPKLVSDLFALEVRYFEGVTEQYSKAKEIEQETQEAAMKNARAEAEKLAKFAGMKVDSVWAISAQPFPEIQNRMFNFNTFATALAAEGPSDTKAEAPPKYVIPPVKVSLSVHVIYLISPDK
jgi:hypothetical protein